MLKIRLQRFGKKNQASFRVVLTESQNSTRSGKFKEILGWHNPRLHQSQLHNEKILYWVSKGAQLSGTIHNILVRRGVIKGKKVHVAPNVRATKEDAPGGGTPVKTAKNEESSAQNISEQK